MFEFFKSLIRKVYRLFEFPIFFNPTVVLKPEESSVYDSDKNDYYGYLFEKKMI